MIEWTYVRLRLPEVGVHLSIEVPREGDEGRGAAHLDDDHTSEAARVVPVSWPTWPGVFYLSAHQDDLGLIDPEAWCWEGGEDGDGWLETDYDAIDQVSTIEVEWPVEDRMLGVRYEVYARTVIHRNAPRPAPRRVGADELMLSTCYEVGAWVNYELVFCASARERYEGARMRKNSKRTPPLIQNAFGLKDEEVVPVAELPTRTAWGLAPDEIPPHPDRVVPGWEVPQIVEAQKRAAEQEEP